MPRGRSKKSIALVDAAKEILEEIQPASVRAVCYRLFTAGLITSMAKTETNRVSRQLTWAREQGEIPWEWIVDETRDAERVASWEDPLRFADVVIRSYRRDYWQQQDSHVEVWSEKGTVRGTLAPVLNEYGVTFRVMHGYASATAVNSILTEALADESRRRWRIFYVGDWDPSGLHMSEVDLPGRLDRYDIGKPWGEGASINIERIALVESDCTRKLPSFAAKTKRSDPRWRWFTERYGQRCWELDALDPRDLRDRVEEAILEEIDEEAWERCKVVEEAERASLVDVMESWRSISRQASK